MRLAVLALACLLLSGSADAVTQKPHAPTTVTSSGLRGPVGVAGAASKTAPISLISRIPTAAGGAASSLAAGTPLGADDLGQCRQACAHAYYFCLAGEAAADCPQSWTSCLSDCAKGVHPLPSQAE